MKWKNPIRGNNLLIIIVGLLMWNIGMQVHITKITRNNDILNDKLTSYNDKIEKIKSRFTAIDEQNQRVLDANAHAYQESLKYYKDALKQLNDEMRDQIEIIEGGYKLDNLLVFKLIDNSGKSYIDHYSFIDIELSDFEKVEYVCQYLNEHYFEEAGIELKSLEEENGLMTATVNLYEINQDNSGWNMRYFQGTAGGHLTELILTEGLLQRGYKNWPVDVVKFSYNDKKIEYEHVPELEIAQYR